MFSIGLDMLILFQSCDTIQKSMFFLTRKSAICLVYTKLGTFLHHFAVVIDAH